MSSSYPQAINAEQRACFDEVASNRFVIFVRPEGGIASFEPTSGRRSAFNVAPRIPGEYYVLPDGALLMVPFAKESAAHPASFWQAERDRLLSVYPQAVPYRPIPGYEVLDLHDEDCGLRYIPIGDEHARARILKRFPKTTVRQVVRLSPEIEQKSAA